MHLENILLPKHGGHCTHPRDTWSPLLWPTSAQLFCRFNKRPSSALLTIKFIPANTVLPKISLHLLPFPNIFQKTWRPPPSDRSAPAHPDPPLSYRLCLNAGWHAVPTNHEGYSTKDFDFTAMKLKSCHALNKQGVRYVMVGTFCLALSSDTLCCSRDNLAIVHYRHPAWFRILKDQKSGEVWSSIQR